MPPFFMLLFALVTVAACIANTQSAAGPTTNQGDGSRCATLLQTGITSPQETTFYFKHLQKNGGASLRLAIGCECGGGKDAKTSELLKGTDDCLKTTYANGVTCLGHFSSPPDPNDETIMVLRDPVSRLESWAAYSGRSISSMIDWAKRSDSTDGLKVVNSLSTSDGRALKRVSFMCFDRLQEDYSKLRSGHKEGHKWSEYLPTTHQRKNTRNANVEATPEERVEIEHIFSEDLKLWKKHCLDEEDYETKQ